MVNGKNNWFFLNCKELIQLFHSQIEGTPILNLTKIHFAKVS